jgi:hypothetical protein
MVIGRLVQSPFLLSRVKQLANTLGWVPMPLLGLSSLYAESFLVREIEIEFAKSDQDKQ